MSSIQPYSKKLTDEESAAIVNQAMAALSRGDDEEYARRGRPLPLSVGMAEDLKKAIGLQALVASGHNLIEVVEAYGEAWFRQ